MRYNLFREVHFQITGQDFIDPEGRIPPALATQVLTLDWPNMTADLCRRICHFGRMLIHVYAAYPEPVWENWRLRSYPVRRVRPMAPRTKQIVQEVIDVSDLRPPADSF